MMHGKGGHHLAHGFTPDRRAVSVREITPTLLREIGARAVLTDLDNTIALHDAPRPTEEGAAWLRSLKDAGIPVYVVSNNHYERVEQFCKPLGVNFVHKSGKPFGRGIPRALAELGLRKDQVVLVGDQLFTDVLAASWNHVPCILTEPIELETKPFLRFKRVLEHMIDHNRRY